MKLAAAGADVAILARRFDVLKAAQADIQEYARKHSKDAPASSNVSIHVADVGIEEDAIAAIREVLSAHHNKPIDAVVHSAGIVTARPFEDITAANFAALYRTNVIGARNILHTALPHVSNTPEGRRNGTNARFVVISSQAGQCGIFGYTGYSPSKFALQGFAQSLQQEMWTRGVRVSLAFPPDTDTPQLAKEKLEKPEITSILGGATATVQPEEVADAIIGGMQRWSPQIAVGFDGWMLAQLTAGFSPCGSFLTGLVQVLTIGLWRAIALVYLQFFYWTIQRHVSKAEGASRGAADGVAATGVVAGGVTEVKAAQGLPELRAPLMAPA